MTNPVKDSEASAPCSADFRTTHWSVVLAAGQSSATQNVAALESLCRTYWFPLYVYVRRQGHGPQDAQDLTQEFFARLLRLNSLAGVAPHKGKFRTFLLVSVNHFLADAWDAAKAAKRGGNKPIVSLNEEDAEERYQMEPTNDPTPDAAFDRRWVLAILERALARLRDEHTGAGKGGQFEQLKTFLENPASDGEYERVALELHTTPGALATAVHRLRQRYRDLVRAEIAQTVTGPEEMEQELGHLFGR
jgi:RNA polymerase sigma-70 factor (ECF subfamily)